MTARRVRKVSEFQAVAKLSDIPEEEGLCVTVGELKIGLFRHKGEVFAINNVCPHQGAPLSEGYFDDGIVNCPLHAMEICVETGRVMNSTDKVDTYPVRVNGETVSVAIS